MPQEGVSERKTEQIYWHFDQFLSCLYRDRFYIRSGDGFQEVPRPIDCGLYIKRADGTEVEVMLQDDEVLIQGGVGLQILTGNEFKAQAHKTVVP